MHITGRKWCDFVVWSTKDMVVVRVLYDEQFFKERMYPQLKRFYFLSMAPELVSPTFPENIPFKDWSEFDMYDIDGP